MGHHPPIGAVQQVTTVSQGSGLSPTTWLLIYASILFGGYLIYRFVKKK